MDENLRTIRQSDLDKIDTIGKDVADIKDSLIKHFTESDAIRLCVGKLDVDINGNGKIGLKDEFHRFKWIAIGAGLTIGIIWTVATFVIPIIHKAG